MKKRDFFKAGLLTIAAFFIPRKIWALKFYPTTDNSEWAVLYGTWCGTSRDAAVWISEGMNGIADVFDVRENPDLSKYKNIVVGGSIRSGKTPQELQDYLTQNRETIKNKIKGLFAVCGNMGQPVTQDHYTNFFDNHLIKMTGSAKVPSKVFLGRITFGLMQPEIREQMQSMPNVEEYDNLKRSECMDFGHEVLNAAE